MMKPQLINSLFDDRNTATGTLLSKRLNYQFHFYTRKYNDSQLAMQGA